MHPEMNFGASVTNCESNIYTAATLCECHGQPFSKSVALVTHLQPPSFIRSASERSTGECEYNSI